MRRYLAFLALFLSAIAPLHAQTLSDVLCSLQERVDVLRQRARLDAHLGSSQAETELPAIVWNGLDNPSVPNPTDGQVANLGVAGQVALLNQAITEFSALRRYFLNLRPEDLAIDSRIGALRPFLREDFPDLGRADADNFHTTVAALARQVAALQVLPWVAQVTTEKLDYTTTKEEIYENGNFSEVLSPVDPGGWQPVSLEAGDPVGLAEVWRKVSAMRAGSPFTNFESLTASGTYTVTTYHDGPNDQNGHSTDYDLKKVYVSRITEYINGVRLYIAAPAETDTAIRGRIALTTRVEWNDDADGSIGSGAPSWQPTDAAYHVIAASSPLQEEEQAPLMETKPVDAPDFDAKLEWSDLTELLPDLSRSTGALKTRRGADAWVQVTNLSRASFAVFAPTFTLGVDATAKRDALARAAEIPAPPPAVPSVVLHPSPGVLVGIPLGAGLEGTSTGWLGVCSGSYEFNSSGDPDPMQPDVFDLGIISPAYNSVAAYTTASLAIRADHAANLRFIGVAADFHVVYATGRGADQRGADLPENQPTAADLAASGWEIQEVLTANDLPRIRQIVGRDYIADVAMNGHFKATVTLYRRPAGSDVPSRTPGEVEDVSELTSLGSFVFERPDTSGLFPNGHEIIRVTDGDSNVYQVSLSSLDPATAAITFTGPFYQKTLTPGADEDNHPTITIGETLDGASLGTSTLTVDADWRWWSHRSPLVASQAVGSDVITATATFDAGTPGSQGGRLPSALKIENSATGDTTFLAWDEHGILTDNHATINKWARTTNTDDDILTATTTYNGAPVATDWTAFTGPATIKYHSAPDGTTPKAGAATTEIQYGDSTTGTPGLPHRITRNDGTATLYDWDGSGGGLTLTVENGKLTGDTLESGTKTITTYNAAGYPEISTTTMTINGATPLEIARSTTLTRTSWGAPLTVKDTIRNLTTTYTWDGAFPRLASLTTPLGHSTGITARDALGRPIGFDWNGSTGTFHHTGNAIDTNITLGGGPITAHRAWDPRGRPTADNLTHAGVDHNNAIAWTGSTAIIQSGNSLTGANTNTDLNTLTGESSTTGTILPFGGNTGEAIGVENGLIHTKVKIIDRPGVFQTTWTDAWGRIRKTSVPTSAPGGGDDVTEYDYFPPGPTSRVTIRHPSGRVTINESEPFNASGSVTRSGLDTNDDGLLGDPDRYVESTTTIANSQLLTEVKGPGEPGRRTLFVNRTDPNGNSTTNINGGEEEITRIVTYPTNPPLANPTKTLTISSDKGWTRTVTFDSLGRHETNSITGTGLTNTTLDPAWRADGTLASITLDTGTAKTKADFAPNGLLTGLIVPHEDNIFGGHSFDITAKTETLVLGGVASTRSIDGTSISQSKDPNTPDISAPNLTPVERTLGIGGPTGDGFKLNIIPTDAGSPTEIALNDAGVKTKHGYIAGFCPETTWLAGGLPSSVSCARGGEIAFGYSGGNRDIQSISYPAADNEYGDPTPYTSHSFTYHPSGKPHTITDGSGTRTLAYENGRINTIIANGHPLGGYQLIRSHDGTGRHDTLTLTLGSEILHTRTIEYNGNSNEPIGITAPAFSASYARACPDTRAITGITRGTLSQSWVRGTAGRIEQSSAAGLTYTHTSWDGRNRRKNMATPHGTWTYQYNTYGQLAQASRPGVPTISLTYPTDAIGRRTPGNNLNQFTTLANPAFKDLIVTAADTAELYINDELMADFDGVWHHLLTNPEPATGTWLPWTVKGVIVGGGAPGAASDATSILSGWTWLPPANEAINYDESGNRKSSALWTYRWNSRNQLVTAATRNIAGSPEGWQISFDYDSEGRRFKKEIIHKTTVNGKSVITKEKVYFVWDGWNLIYERHVNEHGMRLWDREYLWGEDLAGGMDGSEGVGGVGALLLIRERRDLRRQTYTDYYPCYDTSGHVIALTDPAGAIVATYDYGPFGELLAAKGPAATANPFRYATKYFDTETGLYYFGQRYYDPVTGQWLSRELLGEDESLNLYSYCHNDPVNQVDVLGLATTLLNNQGLINITTLIDANHEESSTNSGITVDLETFSMQEIGNLSIAEAIVEIGEILMAPIMAEHDRAVAEFVRRDTMELWAESCPLGQLQDHLNKNWNEPGIGWMKEVFNARCDAQHDVSIVDGVISGFMTIAEIGASVVDPSPAGEISLLSRVVGGTEKCIGVPRVLAANRGGLLFSERSGVAMDAAEFKLVKEAWESGGTGRHIITDHPSAMLEIDRIQRLSGATYVEGYTMSGNMILLRPNATRSGVFEELIHSRQIRVQGMNPKAQSWLMEVQAKETLIRMRDFWQIPELEHIQTLRGLEQLRANPW